MPGRAEPPHAGRPTRTGTVPGLPLATPELAQAEGASSSLVRVSRSVAARMPRFGGLIAFGSAVYGRYGRHRGAVLAGGLAFFGLLSLVPSIVSLGALLAVVVDPAALSAQIQAWLGEHHDVYQALDPLLRQWDDLTRSEVSSIGVAGLIALGISLFAASRWVYVARQVLDITFDVTPRPPTFLARGASILITLAVQVVLVALLAVVPVLLRWLDSVAVLPGEVHAMGVLRVPVVVLVVYLLLTAGLRYGRPGRPVPWVNWGAVIGTLIIWVGSAGLGWYLTVSVTFAQIVAYLGSVIALQLWLFVVGLAIVLAAEIEALRLGYLQCRDTEAPVGAGTPH
jgi:membrane protein